MKKTEMMKEFEDKTELNATILTVDCGVMPRIFYSNWLESELLNAKEHVQNLEFLLNQKNENILQLEAKATSYDRLMSGGKFTMKEMANIKKRPVTIDKDGTINAHGAIPHLARGGFVGFTDCWVNDADDYAEIDESFVEIPEGLDWTYSLTLPDGWEATDDYS